MIIFVHTRMVPTEGTEIMDIDNKKEVTNSMLTDEQNFGVNSVLWFMRSKRFDFLTIFPETI